MAPVDLKAHIERVEVCERSDSSGNVVESGLKLIQNRTSLIAGGQYALYYMNVAYDGNCYILKKRFSDFVIFHNHLQAHFGANMPCDLPSKTALRSFASEELQDRKNCLNAYLKTICGEARFIANADVLKFFQPLVPMELLAHIEHVEVCGVEPVADNVVAQSFSFLQNRVSLLGGGQYAVYHVKVQRDGMRFTIKKRFSEFAVLNDFLKSRFGASMPCDLPSKTPLRQFDADTLESRKLALNAYLREICNGPEFRANSEVQRFFECRGQGASMVDNGDDFARSRPSGDTFPGMPSGAPYLAAGGYGGAGNNAPLAPTGLSSGSLKSRQRHDDDDDLVGWDS